VNLLVYVKIITGIYDEAWLLEIEAVASTTVE